VLVRLYDMLERYTADCEDYGRGEDAERAEQERMSVEW
jgi:hypothetical protein